jgi:hypothetical protein
VLDLPYSRRPAADGALEGPIGVKQHLTAAIMTSPRSASKAAETGTSENRGWFFISWSVRSNKRKERVIRRGVTLCVYLNQLLKGGSSDGFDEQWR